ncbi:MAG: hypothetical protein OXU51_11610 [Candidatus Poribacteria bacterium]|nr:hypothetical protein [Candidatus Poribacteria bacterium]
MVKEFQLMDSVGKVIGHGEIDGDVYRLFSKAVPTQYEEFESLGALLTASGGTGIQPALFDSPARPRQLNLLCCSDKA